MTDFVVVGGGIAGLVAARRLALGGTRVLLIEASDRLGGTVAHHVVGGLILDAGAESFAVRGGIVAALAAEVGLGDDVIAPSPAGAWLHRESATLPLPATSILGIPGVPLAADVIAVVGLRTALRAFFESLMPGTVADSALTLGELVRRRMGAGMLDKLVAPVTQGVHSTHPDDLAVDRVAPGLRAAMRRTGSLARAVASLRASAPAGSAVSGIRGGVHRIVDELAADLQRLGVEVQLGTRVSSVAPGVATVGDSTIAGTIVVAASGVPGAEIEGADAALAHRVTLATLVVDCAALDAAPRGSGVLVASATPGVTARALTHATAKWAWLAERATELAPGRHVLRLSYDSHTLPSDLAEVARVDAMTLLGVDISPADVVDFARVDWARPAPSADAAENITLVGEAVAGTGLAAVIAQAMAAADALLAAHAAERE
ncbi:MAG: protoporphyrinogen/coproporphyrinogen oxidase [Microbacteriaceae bacterium]